MKVSQILYVAWFMLCRKHVKVFFIFEGQVKEQNELRVKVKGLVQTASQTPIFNPSRLNQMVLL